MSGNLWFTIRKCYFKRHVFGVTGKIQRSSCCRFTPWCLAPARPRPGASVRSPTWSWVFAAFQVHEQEAVLEHRAASHYETGCGHAMWQLHVLCPSQNFQWYFSNCTFLFCLGDWVNYMYLNIFLYMSHQSVLWFQFKYIKVVKV